MLLPGTNRTSSYLAVADSGAHRSLHSACHGAGTVVAEYARSGRSGPHPQGHRTLKFGYGDAAPERGGPPRRQGRGQRAGHPGGAPAGPAGGEAAPDGGADVTSTRPRWVRRVAAAAVVGVVLAGCSTGGGTGAGSSGGAPAASAATPGAGDTSGGRTKYARAVDAAAARHLSVWLEADLVRRWREGDASLARAVATLAAARRPARRGRRQDRRRAGPGRRAAQPGRGAGLPPRRLHRGPAGAARQAGAHRHGRARARLHARRAGASPTGRRAARPRPAQRWPGATTAVANAVVDSGYIDVLDLSTGLRDDAEYASWGTDRDAAQRAAWAEVGPARLGRPRAAAGPQGTGPGRAATGATTGRRRPSCVPGSTSRWTAAPRPSTCGRGGSRTRAGPRC